MQANLQPMVTGEVKVEETLVDVAKRLRRLDSMRMWTRKHYLTAPSVNAN